MADPVTQEDLNEMDQDPENYDGDPGETLTPKEQRAFLRRLNDFVAGKVPSFDESAAGDDDDDGKKRVDGALDGGRASILSQLLMGDVKPPYGLADRAFHTPMQYWHPPLSEAFNPYWDQKK